VNTIILVKVTDAVVNGHFMMVKSLIKTITLRIKKSYIVTDTSNSFDIN